MKMITQVSGLLKKNNIEHRIIGNSIIVRRGKKVKIPKRVDEEISYLCGVICGDGCLDKPTRKKDQKFRYRIQITTKNEKYKNFLTNLIKKKFEYKPGIVLHGRHKDIYIESSVIYFYFVCLGLPIGEKFGQLHVPLKISINRALFSSFLSGLLDTDGSYNHGIYLSQKDTEFLNEIKQLIQKFYGISIDIKLSPFRLPTNEVYLRHYIYIPKNQIGKILPFLNLKRIKIG